MPWPHLDINIERQLRTKTHFVFTDIIGGDSGTFSSFEVNNKTLIIDALHTTLAVRYSLMIIAPIIKYVWTHSSLWLTECFGNSTVYTVSQWSMAVWLGSVGRAAFFTIILEFDISPMWGVLDTTVCETVCQLLKIKTITCIIYESDYCTRISFCNCILS
jgi:hypothetical protein